MPHTHGPLMLSFSRSDGPLPRREYVLHKTQLRFSSSSSSRSQASSSQPLPSIRSNLHAEAAARLTPRGLPRNVRHRIERHKAALPRRAPGAASRPQIRHTSSAPNPHSPHTTPVQVSQRAEHQQPSQRDLCCFPSAHRAPRARRATRWSRLDRGGCSTPSRLQKSAAASKIQPFHAFSKKLSCSGRER